MNALKSIKPLILFLISIFLYSYDAFAQEETGLPGDHFNLEATLSLFKKSESLEDFEKKLNEEKSAINNLDLNEDGEIDYIRVIDNMEGDLHAISLQVPFSKTESQDIAVIEIEKTGAETALLQIVGDENIFGEAIIVEPFEEQATNGKKGPNSDLEFTRIIVNVWAWPSVRYIYRPHYRAWVSPWRWAYYPRWWKPWRPCSYRIYHQRHIHHRSYFRVATTHRVTRAHRVYTPHRRSSVVVVKRTTTIKRARVAPKKGQVRHTKTTTVKKRNSKVKASKKTSTVKSKNRHGHSTTRKKTRTKRKKRRNN